MTIETLSGVQEVTVYSFNGKVSSAASIWGRRSCAGETYPLHLEGGQSRQ